MQSNKEDPADREARLRERRLSLLENREAAQGTSEGLTKDYGSVYNLGALSMFGKAGKKKATAAAPTSTASTAPRRTGDDR